jgi:hypothetical protein
MNKARILENIDVAIATIESLPPERVNLNTFGRPAACGTIACIAGHIAGMPHFIDQGWRYKGDDYPCIMTPECGQLGMIDRCPDLLDAQFGPDAWDAVFSLPGRSPLDTFGPEHIKRDHQAEALHRLKEQRRIVDAQND